MYNEVIHSGIKLRFFFYLKQFILIDMQKKDKNV